MLFGKKKKSALPQAVDEADEISVSEEELDAAAETNSYYEKVAAVYSGVRYLLLVFLVLLIVLFSIKNSESITYDNLMFLMKDLGSVAEMTGGDFSDISYNPDADQYFVPFRNNLAIASTSGLKIYSSDGDTIFEGSEKFSMPRAESSDRYLLAYDFGGNSFALYNSFARIHSEKLEYDITGADISDSGMFAVVTRTKEYNSSVLLYTKNCKLKNRYLSEDRVIDVSINRGGSRIAILSFTVEDAEFVTKLMISKPGESKSITTLSLSDVFPLSCEYSTDGNLILLCDKAVYFYDENGNLLGSFDITGELEAASLSDEGCVIAVPKNAVTTGSYVTVLSSRGRVIYSGELDGKTASLDYRNGYLFSLCGNLITRTDIGSGEQNLMETGVSGKKMIVYSEKDVLICSSSYAEYCDMSK